MKILFGALMVDGRGKIGGTVASKNRAGSYMRNKVTPVNPQSTKQQFQRQLFGALSSSWRNLPAGRQAGWNQGAANFPYRDVFGASKILSGPQLYQKLNSNLSTAGQPQLNNCPTPVEIPAFSFEVATLELADISIDLNPNAVPAGFSLVIYATPPISNGRNYIKQLYRIISVNPTVTVGTVVLTQDYLNVFGAPISNTSIGIRAVLISNDTGQMGVPVDALQRVDG